MQTLALQIHHALRSAAWFRADSRWAQLLGVFPQLFFISGPEPDPHRTPAPFVRTRRTLASRIGTSPGKAER